MLHVIKLLVALSFKALVRAALRLAGAFAFSL